MNPPIEPAPLWTGALSTLLALILVLGLAWLFLRALKHLQARRAAAGSDGPQLVSAVAVGPRERLVVVAYRGRQHLLAFSAGGVCVVDSHAAAPDANTPAPPSTATVSA